MKNWQKLALCTVIATSLAACSSSDDSGSATDISDIDGVVSDDGAAAGGDDDGVAADDGTTGGAAGDGATDDGAAGGGTTGGDAGDNATGDDAGADDGTAQAAPTPDAIPVSLIGATPRPVNDPFGFTLEFDEEPSAGAPSQPKNLRADLVSSDWAEFSWAPANDDEGVVRYVIERSDGVSYTLTRELDPSLSFDQGTFDEFRKYWLTTSFIDCNFTRFTFGRGSQRDQEAPWNCADTGPMPGATYTYTVTAFDAAGNASAASDPLEITYAGGTDFEPTQVSDFIGDFDLVWNDEFDGDALDASRWQTELVFGDNTFINGEQQYFVPVLEGTDIDFNPFEFTPEGTLRINSTPTPDSARASLPSGCFEADAFLSQFEGRDRCEFLSGALSTHDRMQFVYGYVEARIRASDVAGSLTSFYLFHRFGGENNEENGTYFLNAPEIDILEYLGENPFGDEDAFQTHHFTDVNTGIIRSSPTMNHERENGGIYGGEFHTFSVLWEPNLAIWYINGVEIRRIDGPLISQQPMNIINYLVTGSGFAPEPAENGPTIAAEIDYVRVYQRDAFQGSLSCGNAVNPSACPAVQ